MITAPSSTTFTPTAGAGRPPSASPHAVVQTRQLRKQFDAGGATVEVLAGIDLSVQRGEAVVLQGVSGSGKSTLLHLLGGIERPSSGSVVVAGQDLQALSGGAASDFRARHIGFVFQFFNLLPTLTALENVVCALEPLPGSRASRRDDARAALAAVGLADLADQYPGRLSGGQQQRVAIARAVVKRPALLLADEPTGALDAQTARQVMALLRDLRQQRGCALVIATHDAMVCDYADRVLRLESGRLAGAPGAG